MGAFSTLRATVPWPGCGTELTASVQFKYGHTWQHAYVLGDELRWGAHAVGEPGKAHVVVDGVAVVACRKCDQSFELDLYVHVESDRLARVEHANGKYDGGVGATFVVVSEGADPQIAR